MTARAAVRIGEVIRHARVFNLATLLNDYNPPLDPLWRELTPHLSPTDMDAVQSIAAEIQARIARFRQGLGDTGPSDPPSAPEAGDA